MRAKSAVPSGQGQRDLGGRAIRVAQDAQRQSVRVEHGVGLLLPAVARDRLAEVAGAIEQARRDDRDAEIGCALQVIAREDAEAARVLRQCGGDAELRREVGDRLRGILESLVPARLGEVGVQVIAQGVGLGDEVSIVREFVETRGLDQPEEAHRVASAFFPRGRADRLEQLERRVVPGPAQVRRKLIQRCKRLRQNGANSKPPDCLHRASLWGGALKTEISPDGTTPP